jgi:hypothetical protein
VAVEVTEGLGAADVTGAVVVAAGVVAVGGPACVPQPASTTETRIIAGSSPPDLRM